MAAHAPDWGYAVWIATLRAVPIGAPEAQLDVDAFKQVLFNVIDNAIKSRARSR